MAEKFAQRRPRRPRPDGVLRSFYPGEVVRLLKLETTDYRQLRRLFRLAVFGTGREEVVARTWSRFSFLEILAARVALELAGPSNRPYRLQLAQVERACRVLRERYQVRRPLLDVRLRRVGASIVAEFSSVQLEPTSGQLLIPEVAEFAARYVKERGEEPRFSSECCPEVWELKGPVEVVVA